MRNSLNASTLIESCYLPAGATKELDGGVNGFGSELRRYSNQ